MHPIPLVRLCHLRSCLTSRFQDASQWSEATRSAVQRLHGKIRDIYDVYIDAKAPFRVQLGGPLLEAMTQLRAGT